MTGKVIDCNDKEYSLSDCVEHIALAVAEDVLEKDKRIENIMQECKILNSLTNALIALRLN